MTFSDTHYTCVVVLKLGLGEQCDVQDICADPQAECISGRCGCVSSHFSKEGVCGEQSVQGGSYRVHDVNNM